MGGFGFMMKSMNKVRQNQKRKYVSQGKYKNSKSQSYKFGTTEFNQPKITKEELEKLKSDIRAKGKRQRFVENCITLILTITFLTLLYFLFF